VLGAETRSVASAAKRVTGYIERGKAEGATLATGGRRLDRKGFYLEPTAFTDVTPEMTIAREEIFGPVVSVITYEDEDDAIRIANASDFGLSGKVFSRDPERAYAVGRRMRTGNVGVNGLTVAPNIPFGGYKQSGFDREGGPEGLASFQEIQALYMLG
jgi:acyl-CoA reductase-like NAD-dependent aldehyde dehydrogenase